MPGIEAAHPTVRRGGPRLLLVSTTTTMVMLVLDSSIVGVMLPSMTRELALGRVGQAWIVSAYLLALAVFLPIGGTLADSFGSVTMFVIGMSGFVVASAGIATATGSASLIAWRVVAGMAAAVLMPATMAILLSAFPGPGRARALAVYIGVGQGFSTIGPAFGGFFAEYSSWRYGFLVNVPVGLVGIGLMIIIRPVDIRNRRREWDAAGTCALIVGITGLVLALLQAPQWGWSSAATVAVAVTGAAAIAMFIRRSLSSRAPLLNLRLFSGQVFTGSTVVLFAVGFVTTAATIYGAVALQDSLQLPPAASGLALLPLVLPLLVATRWVGRHYEKKGPRSIISVGSASLTVGLIVIALGLAMANLTVACVGMAGVGAGIGGLMSPMTNAGMSVVPQDQRGQASGMVSTCRQLGGILGVGAFSALASAFPAHRGSTVVPGIVAGFVVSALVMLIAGIVGWRLLRRSVPMSAARQGDDLVG